MNGSVALPILSKVKVEHSITAVEATKVSRVFLASRPLGREMLSLQQRPLQHGAGKPGQAKKPRYKETIIIDLTGNEDDPIDVED